MLKLRFRKKTKEQRKHFHGLAPYSYEARHCRHNNGDCNKAYIVKNGRETHFLQLPNSRSAVTQPLTNHYQNSHFLLVSPQSHAMALQVLLELNSEH